ncbi:hypothetical protein ACFJIV_10615 [Mucilaginibacter sp. UC70_90]
MIAAILFAGGLQQGSNQHRR